MSYSFDSHGRLCCDNCGNAGGVRKRTCPHRVLTDSLRGPRAPLPYCYPPALCPQCWHKIGGAQLHADWREGAAQGETQHDATESLLDTGKALSSAPGVTSTPWQGPRSMTPAHRPAGRPPRSRRVTRSAPKTCSRSSL